MNRRTPKMDSTVGDYVVLAAAIVAPAALSGCLVAFVKRRRRATSPARWYQLVAGNAIALLLLLSLLLVAGECYFRFCYDATDSFSQTRTSQRWFERHFQRNNVGFRDSVDYTFRLEPGRRRVSFIGDSFTAGHGIANVEDRFANRVRRLGRGQFDVHVLAEVGRDTGAEIKLIEDLRREGYQFDVVVLVYCLNDINDSVQLKAIQPVAMPAGRPGFLIEHSFLINTLYYRLKARLDPDVSKYYDFVRTAYDGAAWEEQKSRLRSMRDMCYAAGGQLTVVIFPFMHSLGAKYEYRSIHEKIDEFCQGVYHHGSTSDAMPYLDLLPVLEPHAAEKLTVSSHDAHPNERAHELAAQAIFDWLQGILVER